MAESKKYHQARKKHFEIEISRLKKINVELEKQLDNKRRFSLFIESEIAKKQKKIPPKMDDQTIQLLSKLTFSSQRKSKRDIIYLIFRYLNKYKRGLGWIIVH